MYVPQLVSSILTLFLLLIAAKPVVQKVQPIDATSLAFNTMLRTGAIFGALMLIVWSFVLVVLGPG